MKWETSVEMGGSPWINSREGALTTRTVLGYSNLATITEIGVGEELMMQQGTHATDARFKEIQGKVRTWLGEEGWYVRDEPVPDTAWAITARDEQGRAILTAQRIGKPNLVVIQGALISGPDVLAKMRDLDQTERQEFYHNLQCGLLGMGVEYAGIGDPFENMLVVNRIYHDGLTRSLSN